MKQLTMKEVMEVVGYADGNITYGDLLQYMNVEYEIVE